MQRCPKPCGCEDMSETMMKMAGFDNFVSGGKKRVGANSFEYDCKPTKIQSQPKLYFLALAMNTWAE